jgi:peptidyl-prolyl cis-trans isomerase SurA
MCCIYSRAEIIEEIYAVVNDEIITLSEVRNFEQSIYMELSNTHKGEELEKKMAEVKENFLSELINRKILLSKAKEKNYDVEQYVTIYIENLRKENGLSAEELRQAVQQRGVAYDTWLQFMRDQFMQEHLIRDEVASTIKIDNPEIMAYYKQHSDQFTTPVEITLNCIYLDKASYLDEKFLAEKAAQIKNELTAENFTDIARQYSQLPDSENKERLGVFKKGELDPALETVAMTLKKDQYSDWIDTASGWYIIQLVSIKEAGKIAYNDVREKIYSKIFAEKQGEALKTYIEKLKSESFIKIYKEKS